MRNIYTLGNTCKPNFYCLKYLKDYTVKTVFAGVLHNQLMSQYAVLYYFFNFYKYTDIFDEKNWIVLKSVCEQ